jgi:hypothetical protein
MRGWLSLALVLVLLLSGCAQKGDTTSSTAPATATATGHNTTSSAPNHPPTASLTPHLGNGTAALNATFTVAGSDPDGDALSWTLSFGDATANATGAALPSNVTHAYKAAGTVNVTLAVSDGRNTTLAHATLNLTAGTVAFTSIDLTKTWTVSAAGAIEFAAGCREDGVDCAYFDLPEAAGGRDFTMEFSSTVPGAVYFIDTYDAGGYVDTFIGDPGSTTIADKVPDGIIQFRAYSSGGADNTAHLLVP